MRKRRINPKLLLQAARQRQTTPEATPTTNILDDLPFLFKKVCGLKLNGRPVPTGFKREPKAWADLRAEAAWMLGWNFLRKPLPKGKWGRLLLEPRGGAKSTKLRTLDTGLIIADRDTTIHYLSQSVGMAARRVTWVRQRLKANEARFGAFETRANWGNEAFTVVRSGSSDDPTMLAGGPDKDVTGSHPDRQDWDDPVVRKTNRTRTLRRQLIRTFESTLDQRAESAEVNIIGTVYPGHNLYKEIREHYRDDFEILRIGAWGCAYDAYDNVVWGDPDSKELNYPWFTEEFLASKQRTPAAARAFRGQYLNLWLDDEDAPFEVSFLVKGEPPLTKDGKLHPRLAVYMLTDLAQSMSPDASETALIVVAKDTDGVMYVVDIDLGRWNPDVVQERFLTMYHRWENQGLRYATMETRGPGRDAIYNIPKLARVRGERVPVIIPLPRLTSEDKDSRIGQLYAPFKAHLIRFATKLIAKPHLFRIDSRGTPVGLVAERILDYSAASDTPNDFMDALSDAYAIVKDAQACPDPSPPRQKKRPETDYEWSVKRAAGRLGRTRVIT